MRAPLLPQLARTDALIVIGDGKAAEPVAAAIAGQAKPALRAHLRPNAAVVASLGRRRVLAFAGIGDPERFFRTLRESGVDVVSQRVFPDHHPFSAAEIEALIRDADQSGAMLVTTEKDLMRLRGKEFPHRVREVAVFAVTLDFEDEPALRKFITDRLFRARQKKFRRDD